MEINETNVISAARLFDALREDSVLSAERYGCGHINDTYLIRTEAGKKYILQRINDYVFKDVPALMRNIVAVTEYIATKSSGDKDDLLKVLPAVGGASYVLSDGKYFRMYNFIENAVSIESKPTPKQFELSAIGFGRFQKQLDGFPADTLVQTIPRFHDTRSRYADFETAVKEDRAGRLKNAEDEVRFYLDRQRYSPLLAGALEDGTLTKRVTHNDTKLNNVLINLTENKAACVIDLDTVMPGAVAYDFGDSIRFGASTAAEDETELEKVHFSIELFEAFARGFLSESGDRLTEAELDSLALGALIMTYECGMRFLGDYLNGDVYFRITHETHNLERARTQLTLLGEMEAMLPSMQAIIRKYA